jgi:hypothetical protein
MPDWSIKPIEELIPGDEVIGFTHGVGKGRTGGLLPSKVLAIGSRTAKVVRVTDDCGVSFLVTPDHPFSTPLKHKGPSRTWYYRPSVGEVYSRVYTKFTPKDVSDWNWLAGVFDSEGKVNSYGGTILISQSKKVNPEICTRIERILSENGIKYVYRDDCMQYFLYGGRSTKLAFLPYVAKKFRLVKSLWLKHGIISEDGGRGKFVKVEPVGETVVYNFETSTENYVANGYAVHNCQYLNNPAAPENAAFHPEWLRHFKLRKKLDGRLVVEHEVYDGSVRRDIEITHLGLAEVTDPAHAGNAGLGRCRHSVVVLGLSDDDHYYLLDCWANATPYDDYFGKIYEFADKWNIRKLGVETVAAQRFVAYHIDYRNRQANRYLKIIPLKGEVEGPDGTITRRKESRILTVLQPIFEEGRFWCQRHHMDFIGEYTTFPKGRFCDILDALAYAPQVLKSFAYSKFMPAWMASNRQRLTEMAKPYSVGVN